MAPIECSCGKVVERSYVARDDNAGAAHCPVAADGDADGGPAWGMETAESGGSEHAYLEISLTGCFMAPAASKLRNEAVPLLVRQMSPELKDFFGQAGSVRPS